LSRKAGCHACGRQAKNALLPINRDRNDRKRVSVLIDYCSGGMDVGKKGNEISKLKDETGKDGSRIT